MNEENSIFRIELNDKGAEQVRRIHPLVKLLFWCNLAVELLLLVYSFRNYLLYRKAAMAADYPIGFRFTIFLVYVVLTIICGFFYCYYFLRFAGLAKRSLSSGDSYSFNESFTWIKKAVLLGIASVFLNGSYYIFDFFVLH
jgi:hypothetical protein